MWFCLDSIKNIAYLVYAIKNNCIKKFTNKNLRKNEMANSKKQSEQKNEKSVNNEKSIFIDSQLSINKKNDFVLPKSKLQILDNTQFFAIYEKSLNLYQLKKQSVLNLDSKLNTKLDLMKSQIFNITKLDNNILSCELLLNINNKFVYSNAILFYHEKFNFSKFNANMLLKNFSDSLLEKNAIKNLNKNDAIKNNLSRLNKYQIPKLKKNKNTVLLNVRFNLNKNHYELIESFLNSIQNYIASNFDIKTKSIIKSDSDQI